MKQFVEVLEEASQKEYRRRSTKPDYTEASATRTGKVTEMILKGLKRTRAKYTDDAEGFEIFRKRSMEFLQEIQDWNESQDESKHQICPSIELWCAYLGIARVTLKYYTEYSYPEYPEFIEIFRNAIQSNKFDFASHGQINPMVYVFDVMNNGTGYKNTNQIGLVAVVDKPKVDTVGMRQKYLGMGADDLPELPDDIGIEK